MEVLSWNRHFDNLNNWKTNGDKIGNAINKSLHVNQKVWALMKSDFSFRAHDIILSYWNPLKVNGQKAWIIVFILNWLWLKSFQWIVFLFLFKIKNNLWRNTVILAFCQIFDIILMCLNVLIDCHVELYMNMRCESLERWAIIYFAILWHKYT